MTRSVSWAGALLLAVIAVAVPGESAAQPRPAPRPAPAAPDPLRLRGLAELAGFTFTASESFEAVLGTRSGTLFGGGVEVILPQRIFASLRASRFQKDGQRVFVFEGETFDLGIDTTVRITPVEVTGGYRFAGAASRIAPYVGAGLGWHRYEETSESAEDDENVNETHQGYHLLGGVEARIARWFGLAGEIQWTTVPDALAQEPNAVSTAFGETNLGGVGFRVKFVVGR